MSEQYTQPGTKSTTKTAATTFEMLNSAADHAHLFSKLEFACLIKAISHANNRTGDVTLAAESFAEAVGGGLRHVRRALASLAARGYLIVLRAGGGRNITNTRRVVLPFIDRKRATQTRADSAPVSAEETRAFDDTNPGILRTKPGHLTTQTRADSARGTSLRTANRTSQQQIEDEDDAVEVEIEGEEEEQKRRDAVSRYLAALNITGPKARDIADNVVLWPIHIAAHQLRMPAASKIKKSESGWLIHAVTTQDIPKINPRVVCVLANAGFVASVCGVPANGDTRQNPGFLQIGRQQILAKDLSPSRIEMRDPPSLRIPERPRSAVREDN